MNEEQITALERLASLRDSGAVSAQEFEALKAEILDPNKASGPMSAPMPTSAPTPMSPPTPPQRPTPPQGAASSPGPSPRSAAQSADFATLVSRAATLPRWVKIGAPIILIALVLKVFGGGTGSTSGSEASANDASASQTIGVQSGRGVMPDVTCMDLQSAQDRIQEMTEVFFVDSRDATGQDRSQIVDSNWQVVAQTPVAGAEIGDTAPMLSVVKFGEESGRC